MSRQLPGQGLTGGTSLHERQVLGRRAEELALASLSREGLQLVCRNWRRPEGELDLVMREGDTCVFVEVRSRTGTDRGHPLETVTRAKRAQVVRAARHFLAEETVSATDFRFDVVAVTFDDEGAMVELVHVPDAFTTNE